MTEVTIKDDPLTRIQREIKEVTEREKEFKEGHFRVNRMMSESAIHVNGLNGINGHNGINNHNGINGHNGTNGHTNGDVKVLNRAVSTSFLSPPKTPLGVMNTNGYTRRFTPQNGQKGIMQRFIASKGKLQMTPPINMSPKSVSYVSPVLMSPVTPAPVPVIRTSDIKAVRKGYVPVEQKIQKELREMKDREHELKKMRKKRQPFDLASLESDEDSSSESDDDDIPMPGKLKITKSIGELYEALSEELRTPSPGNGHDSLGSLKPAKSLAELCELHPGQEFLAPSSTHLIQKWESMIQQKAEAGAA